jgi:hypothetical protein
MDALRDSSRVGKAENSGTTLSERGEEVAEFPSAITIVSVALRRKVPAAVTTAASVSAAAFSAVKTSRNVVRAPSVMNSFANAYSNQT